MCGIVGYTGKKEVKDILLNGLKKLEYRGYDSAGVAIEVNGMLVLRRCEGKIANLEKIIHNESIIGTTGIGHTRWATHGRPSEENAHPHTDCKGRIVVVHNGIIENYISLKKRLEKEGHRFRSETDTEVIAHLIEKCMSKAKTKDLLRAVHLAVGYLKGSFAIACISLDDPDTIVAARQFSPLIIGIGKEEHFVASDIPAILEHTRNIISMNDGQIAKLTPKKVDIYDLQMKKVSAQVMNIPWDPVTAEKSGYRHFMLKEIFEQPRTIEETFRGRISLDPAKIFLETMDISTEDIKNIQGIVFIGCGTAYHAGIIGKYIVENEAKIPADVDVASEFRYRDPLVNKNTLVVAISQSGETADTIQAVREARKKGAKAIAICNVIGSSITREVTGVIYTRTGPEIGVASTKAFTAQIVAVYMLALYLGTKKGVIKQQHLSDMINDLLCIPKQIETILKKESLIKVAAHKYFTKKDFLYLGRHYNYPIALEGALKLKEISYIHAEGYPAGEMKHGPIALIDQNMPVVVITTKSSVYEKILSNIEEIKARSGLVIAIANKGDKKLEKIGVDDIFYVPKTSEVLSTILNTVTLQLFAYHVAELLGCDIDQPRNLAKSVVVE
ncbi:MAG: glutamine--fructose-6-phosphate transaminase (isomerizing) [Candidatus Omnitrophica bacterium]|nr:glutamine--fructose-6-phosphate transaminase (isomerizing) [Candidatus Omnitrophota bacterium]